MQNKQVETFIQYNPPMYVRKIPNFEKGIYERKGHWTEKEKIKYAVFVQVFKEKFQDKENPILNRMFRVMSDFIKTRNHNQCRSHHQKMEKERFQIDGILQVIKSKYHPRQYQILSNRYKEHIRTIDVEMVMREKGYTPHRKLQRRKKKNLKKQEVNRSNQSFSSSIQGQEECSEIISQKIQASKKIIKIQTSPIKTNKEEENQLQINIERRSNNKIQQQNDYNNDTINKDLANQKKQEKTGDVYQSQDQGENIQIAAIEFPQEIIGERQKLQIREFEKPFKGDFHNSEQQKYNILQKLNLSMPQTPEELNYYLQMKNFQEEKKWHLQEAHKAYEKMNGHLQQASQCETNKNMLMKFYIPTLPKHNYPNFPF